MKPPRWTSAFVTVCIAAFLAVLVLAYVRGEREHVELTNLKIRATILAEFCTKTRSAIHQDRVDIESTDAVRRDAAMARFYESETMHHNAASILMCIDASTLPTFPSMCWVAKDAKCMGEAAERIEHALAGGTP